ncbi:MAG: NAD(P)H-dependent oxidoreductase, partial [Gammaproteobacteria bacterium]|nr:NAD(P)H-dependent oxidoreductase [Gammaproteobacteria bacterium]
MTKILVLYYSAGGTTKSLAHLVARGVEKQGAEAIVRTVPSLNNHNTDDELSSDGDIYVVKEDLLECDGLAVGSPTRFGTMAAPLKHFLEQTSDFWLTGKLANKPVGFFTSSSMLHAGQESTLLSMILPFLHHGMLVCGLPFSQTDLIHTSSGGSPYGASHWNGEDSNL